MLSDQRRDRPLQLLVAAFILFASMAAPTASAEMIALVGGTVIDPAAAVPATKATVVIDGDKILAVGERVPVPDGARVIHAEGKFLTPGLWDMHAHLAAEKPVGMAPEHYVGIGVLGVRDMGGFLDQLLPLRDAIKAGKRVGPDIVLAGATLNGEASAPFHRLVRTEEEGRRAVRELQNAGVDFIKIHRRTTREAFFGIADETSKLGLRLVGHVPLAMSWAETSAAGIHTIEHIQTIFENEERDPKKLAAGFDDLVAKLNGPHGDSIWATLVKNRTYFDPTMVAYEENIAKAGPEIAPKRQAAFAPMKALVARAARAGVPILAGSDLMERHGDRLLRELELLVEVGLTPQEALAAATTTASASLQLAERARLAAGAPATLLLLDADPLADITNLRKLSLVVLRGKVLDAAKLTELRNLQAAPE